ncbi:hypothetical protein HRS9122_08742 [Pyrenophora teres f. teres]|nr:hypothetical protein HRS9122_08742 [Pyrenophora teres f. teres]
MTAQRQRARNGFKDVGTPWTQLLDTSAEIELSSELKKGHMIRFEKVTQERKKKGLRAAALKQHKFLDKVFRIDSDYHTLCSIAFSQSQIDSTRQDVLNKLIEKIREHRDDVTIISPSMRSLFAGLGKSLATRQESVQRLASADDIWYEYKHAEPEGTLKVFGDYLADKIKSTELKDKRAVTMRLPMWPLSRDCFMSVELREESVKELAMALFKVEVDRVADALHIIHHGGVLQTCHDSKDVLSRVLDEDIVAVFGSDVLAAINASHVRANELAKGRARTECVKMTFSKRMGTIDLIMGTMEGIKIQNKLGATAA